MRQLASEYVPSRPYVPVGDPIISPVLARTSAQTVIAAGGRTFGVTRFQRFSAFGEALARTRLAMPRKRARHADPLWRFLDNRRGQMYCSTCLAVALGATDSGLSRAIVEAEGHGALRRHGPCAICGKERLVCGLGAN